MKRTLGAATPREPDSQLGSIVAHSSYNERRSRHYHAKIVGQDLKKLKKLNPSADQTMVRQGLVTSRATGG